MTQRTDLIEVRISVPDEEVATRLSDALVGGGAAACVQRIGPIQSTYTWNGTAEHETEWLLLAKTTATGFGALRDIVVAEHPYDVPEVLAVPVTAALDTYAGWVREQVQR